MQDNFGGTGLGMGLPNMVPDSVSGCPIGYRANEVLHFSFLLNYKLYCKQNLPSKALWNVPEYHQQSGSGVETWVHLPVLNVIKGLGGVLGYQSWRIYCGADILLQVQIFFNQHCCRSSGGL